MLKSKESKSTKYSVYVYYTLLSKFNAALSSHFS